MKFTELKKSLNGGYTAQIFCLEGEDAYFRERGLELLKTEFVTEPQMNYSETEGVNAVSDIDGFLTAVNMYPFLSDKRMVVVKEFYPKADFVKENLKALFENPPLETVLVIVNTQKHDAFKGYEKITFVDCDKAEISVLIKYVTATAYRAGVDINSLVAEKICEFCLLDMTKIANETAKLINYAYDKKIVTVNDVENLCYKDSEYRLYEMTDFIAKKQRDKALTVVKELLSKGETPQRLLISIYNYFKRLLSVALSTDTNAELAKVLGIKEFAVKKAKEQASAFKKKALKQAVDIIANYDYMSKTGKITFDDALDTSILKIMSL